METIPAINANGYYSTSKKKFLALDEALDSEMESLNLYNQLEYNAMFDNKNKNEVFFP